jgi:4-amino-4-deoxy-L-arabinose transferase-like glycosyltransferase
MLESHADPDAPASTPQPAKPPATRRDRAALVMLLIATAVLYLWDITINSMGNPFYAAAAQAGSRNWEALLFGSLDPRNFITVDKPPVSQWVMGLSGQIFGFNSASMLIPEALMAVASVALVYGAVSRVSGRRAGLLAGAALALTPVAVLMFRFNNPDAAMVLMMTISAYCTVRALQRASAAWMAWAGVALGFAFLAKMLEGLMIVPAVALAYLIAAPTSLRKRLLHLVGAAVAVIVSSGWFVVLTLAWPASSRPYLAGSTDNSFMNLVLGYNGISRVLGHNWPDEYPGGRPGVIGNAAGDRINVGASAHAFGGGQSKGLLRLFSGEFGFEIGWLLPAALLAVVLVIVARGRAPRTDVVRAATILFGGWILVDGLVLSFMQGFIHPYYTLSIAPAIAAMFAIGVHEMWQRRASRFGRLGLAAMLLTTGIWSWWILGRNGGWLPPLRWAILTLTVIAGIALLTSVVSGLRPRVVAASLGVGLVGAIGGSAAYAIATIGQPHVGGGPWVGPPSSASSAPQVIRFQKMFDQLSGNAPLNAMLAATDTEWSAAIDRSSAAAVLELATNTPVMAIGGFSGGDPTPTLNQFIDDVHQHRVRYYIVEEDKGISWFHSRGHADIGRWVSANFKPITVGSATVYDLSSGP